MFGVGGRDQRYRNEMGQLIVQDTEEDKRNWLKGIEKTVGLDVPRLCFLPLPPFVTTINKCALRN